MADYDDGFPSTAPVMSFKPNKQGLFDLGGNVWEWVEDWYDSTKNERELRGGGWTHHDRVYLVSSSRYHLPPFYRSGWNGFRCVLENGGPPRSSSPAARAK